MAIAGFVAKILCSVVCPVNCCVVLMGVECIIGSKKQFVALFVLIVVVYLAAILWSGGHCLPHTLGEKNSRTFGGVLKSVPKMSKSLRQKKMKIDYRALARGDPQPNLDVPQVAEEFTFATPLVNVSERPGVLLTGARSLSVPGRAA